MKGDLVVDFGLLEVKSDTHLSSLPKRTTPTDVQ